MFEKPVSEAISYMQKAVLELDSELEKYGMNKPERTSAICGAVGRILVEM